MAYVTITDLAARVGSTLYARLTDRVNGAAADAAVAQQIVDEAEAEANGYLAARYATPVSLATHPETADLLAARVLDLAEYAAWKSSPFVANVPERIRLIYAAAIEWLQAVARGDVPLPAATILPARTAENEAPRFTAPPRVFTAEQLSGL